MVVLTCFLQLVSCLLEHAGYMMLPILVQIPPNQSRGILRFIVRFFVRVLKFETLKLGQNIL